MTYDFVEDYDTVTSHHSPFNDSAIFGFNVVSVDKNYQKIIFPVDVNMLF